MTAEHGQQPTTAGHGHSEHDHGAHDHAHGGGPAAWWHKLGHVVTPHSHDSADKVDQAMETSRDGIRALWISLAVLGATAVLQAVVIVAVIAASSALAGYEALRRLLHPATVSHLPYVAAAALVGFAGNEIVARYRITVGRRIGSAALVADGLHARTDGFTSLAVLLGAGGVAIGWRWADPVVGLLITIAILFVLKDAAREVYRRLMDAVDPALVDTVTRTLRQTDGVADVGAVHLRWIGRASCRER